MLSGSNLINRKWEQCIADFTEIVINVALPYSDHATRIVGRVGYYFFQIPITDKQI